MSQANSVEITVECDEDEVEWGVDIVFDHPASSRDLLEAIATILHTLAVREGLSSKQILQYVIDNSLKTMDGQGAVN